MLTVTATSKDLILDITPILRKLARPRGESVEAGDVTKIRIPPAETSILRDGDVISSVPLGDDTYEHVQFTGHISLAEPGVIEGEPLVPALADLGRYTQGVLDSFAAL